MKRKSGILILAVMLVHFSATAADFDSAAMVSAHNKWRNDAGVKEPLVYSTELEVSAQAWAGRLKQENQCRMKHSDPQGKYGENLYWASALNWSDGRKDVQKITPAKVVDSWGSEKTDYRYENNSCAAGKMCGHYTQVVWRATRKVGCAVAVCEDTRNQVWVCQYQPAGNVMGRRPY